MATIFEERSIDALEERLEVIDGLIDKYMNAPMSVQVAGKNMSNVGKIPALKAERNRIIKRLREIRGDDYGRTYRA